MRSPQLLLLLGLTTLILGSASAREPSVVASATASSDYVRAKDANGNPLPETYVFAEGKHFSGITQDGSLERMTFPAMTKILATNLAKQNYFPTTKVESTDLIIMVHWGTTEVFEDPMRDQHIQDLNNALASYNESMASGGGRADPTDINSALSDRESAQNSQTAAINRNAQLLGYARSLAKERKLMTPTLDEIAMSEELAEERYFVILVAYDNRTRIKGKKPRPVWITRLSIRSPGNNFTEALPALAKAGSEVFGQQHDDLVHVKVTPGNGSVKLGELEVIGQANEKTPPAQTK